MKPIFYLEKDIFIQNVTQKKNKNKLNYSEKKLEKWDAHAVRQKQAVKRSRFLIFLMKCVTQNLLIIFSLR